MTYFSDLIFTISSVEGRGVTSGTLSEGLVAQKSYKPRICWPMSLGVGAKTVQWKKALDFPEKLWSVDTLSR